MKGEEERLMSELRASEASMMSSLYQIDAANPEQPRMHFNQRSKPYRPPVATQKGNPAPASGKEEEEVDVDDYEN